MKAFFYFSGLLLAVLAARPSAAQTIPNGNFETWASPFGVETPTNWQTTDDILAYFNSAPAGSYNTGTVTKTTDAHGGSFAAKLSTLGLPTTTGGTAVLPGYLVLGKRVSADAAGNLYGGLPFATRPTQMQFYYKLTGTNATADQAAVQVVFTRTTNGASQIIGEADAVLAPASSYTAKTLTIAYSSSVLPDSVTIYAVSGSAQTVTAGTTLQLDDITMLGTGLAVRADAGLQAQLTVAPNPSPAGRFVISSPTMPELAAAPLTVLDAMGSEVLRQPAQAVPTTERALDLSNLALGIYLLRLDSKQGAIVRQLVVK